MHATRHTWATLALQAGKSVRWVADQLGHADPAFTMRVYAHALREEETDLSFASFGDPKRPYTAPALSADPDDDTQLREVLGGPRGGRTHDQRVKSPVLYQLS
jgi:hypothetical protein